MLDLANAKLIFTNKKKRSNVCYTENAFNTINRSFDVLEAT